MDVSIKLPMIKNWLICFMVVYRPYSSCKEIVRSSAAQRLDTERLIVKRQM